jgi:hypothetical protein
MALKLLEFIGCLPEITHYSGPMVKNALKIPSKLEPF